MKERWNSGTRSPYLVESYDEIEKSEVSDIESRLIYTLNEDNFTSKDQEKIYGM